MHVLSAMHQAARAVRPILRKMVRTPAYWKVGTQLHTLRPLPRLESLQGQYVRQPSRGPGCMAQRRTGAPPGGGLLEAPYMVNAAHTPLPPCSLPVCASMGAGTWQCRCRSAAGTKPGLSW